ncbi:MAG: ATP-binding protein [Acidobacteriota bacterium]
MKSQKPAELLSLANLLRSENPNYSRILDLATKLANQDPKRVRFTTDAGIVSRLGRELVARQETAVSELVKNAYDADANVVQVIFSNAKKAGGNLLVIDNGLGMSRQELIDGFMRLASTGKIEQPLSSRYRRKRAGRKGIGRFATQRLGSRLELTTQTLQTAKALRLTLDWDEFAPDRELTSVTGSIFEVAKEQSEGTTLLITGLREAWSDAQIARAYRFVDELIQPFPLSKRKKKTEAYEDDPGFKATFYRRISGKKVEVASEERMVFDHALAEVTASVNAQGLGEWHLACERYNLNEKSRITPEGGQTYAHLHNVYLKAYYFIWHPSLIPRQVSTRLREIANEQGGIRLYRNGFRVLPYGEPHDDWLVLDKLYRRRSILYPLSNINWFGFVEITDPTGTTFEETSSREGVANNPAFHELTSFASRALIEAAQRVASARKKKLTASQKEHQGGESAPSEQSLKSIADELEAIAKRLRNVSEQTAVRKVAKKVLDVGKALLEENGTLRVLSSLGLTIAIFAHEVRHQIFSLRQATGHGSDRSLTQAEQKNLLSDFDSRLKVLHSYIAYFDKTISASISREVEPQPLTKILFGFIDQFKTVVERRGTRFVGEDQIEEALMTKPMHSSEWASILSNLLTNALKAIKRGPHRGNGHILIRAWRSDEKIVIEFADNGDGIPTEIQNRVFDPFFTMTAATEASDDELVGMGLGLTIVRDILTAYGGSIGLTKAPRGYATCFRIEIASSNEGDE